jgi:1,4-alpha-glucan branching enzyme
MIDLLKGEGTVKRELPAMYRQYQRFGIDMSKEPIHRKHHQEWLTFGTVYVFNEHFVLPLSHDEVVHLKKSLFGRMPGDEWQRFANLRLLYCYQWFFPGKKLLFMGGEFAQEGEWDSAASLPWQRAAEPLPAATMRLLAALNRLQAKHPSLAQFDCDPRGFEWLDGEDRQNSVICFLRHSAGEALIIALNFTPEPRMSYRIPVHYPGTFRELFNSDAGEFGGTGQYRHNPLVSEPVAHRGRQHSLVLNLPPLAALVLQRAQRGNHSKSRKN